MATGCSRPVNWSDVRSVRYPSAAFDLGDTTDTSIGWFESRHELTTGMSPKVESPEVASRSSLVFSVSSRYSRRPAHPTPRTAPTSNAKMTFLRGAGLIGDVGTAAFDTS